ncbi:MAG: M48 family metalloprotease [Nanoarchaeota archaeon]|nr:M48 family metalloprotease [Nanoarchaeota archaeon]
MYEESMTEESEFEGHFKKVYLEVLEKFPWVGKDEVTLKYNPLIFIISFLDVNPYILMGTGQLVKSPYLLVSDDFFTVFDDEQKKAIIAHELGHYKRSKDYSLEKLTMHAKFKDQLFSFYSLNHDYKEMLRNSDKKLGRKIDRLEKWRLLDEMHADNKAVKAGYKEPLLSALERTLKEYGDCIGDPGRNMVVERVKNIKKRS